MKKRLITIEIDYTPPLDWAFLLRYLKHRATPGVESVSGECYTRTFQIDKQIGIVSISHHPSEPRILVEVPASFRKHEVHIVERIRRMFDLDVDLSAVHAVLNADEHLRPMIANAPGLRIPAAWCPFEMLARTIVGQQVSVRGASTIMGRIVSRLGEPIGDQFLFPTSHALATGNLDGIGMPGKRVIALQNVARVIATNAIPFPDKDALLKLPGIGPWTVEYFAMKAMGEADAWPGTDLVLKRVVESLAGSSNIASVTDRWKPYRAYAAMHLWLHSATALQPTQVRASVEA